MKLTKIFGIVLSLHIGVILLVMFQPGCQTVVKKEGAQASSESADQSSFNQGISKEVDQEENEYESISEFVEPTRPQFGELIVPGQDDESPSFITSTADQDNSSAGSFQLRPSDMSIYKVQRGDTLWGIARKNNLSLSDVLKANANLDKDSKLSIGQELMIPDTGFPEENIPNPLTESSPDVSEDLLKYIVRKGDSLSRISREYGVSLVDLMEENGLTTSSIIRPGQSLVIPSERVSKVEVPKDQDSITVPEGSITHEVIKGDNLTRISAIYETTVQQIMEWNELSDSSKIRVGQKLIVAESFSSAEEILESSSAEAPILTVPLEESTLNSSVQDFFNGEVQERPIIDLPSDQ